MRVSLPVDPMHKTLSEVATLQFVRANTDILVPRVIAFDASYQNELGFEWILMELMPGHPYGNKWTTLPCTAKETMVKRLAHFSAQLFRLRFSGIGNIYRKENCSPPSEEFIVGRIASLPFFYKNRLEQDVPRGLFASSRDWLAAHLCFPRNESNQVLSDPPPKDDPNDGDYQPALSDTKTVKELVDSLSIRLQWLFPWTESTEEAAASPEETILFHDDINTSNILVDDDGNMTALVDWECVSALPLWRACQLPKFLQILPRDDKPDPETYAHPLESNDLCWDHLEEYEQTQFCRIFLEEMERLEPEWVSIHRATALKQDFEDAIRMSYDEWSYNRVRKWLRDVDAGIGGKRLVERELDGT